MGWELAGEQRPLFFVPRGAVKPVPVVYHKMPVLEQLQMAGWLKEEGTKLFLAADYDKAAEKYVLAINVLKMCKFKNTTQVGRAIELTIPCYNNAATCHMKRQDYGEVRLLSENVDIFCSKLERNRGGMEMEALKGRGVEEIKVLGHWWCRACLLLGKACLYQGDYKKAVECLRKGSELAKPAALARLRAEMDKELEKATKLSASDT